MLHLLFTHKTALLRRITKGEAVLLHAKQPQRGGRGTALPILNPGTRRG